MRITAEQQKIVDSLNCERLSNNEANIRLVEGFYNTRNNTIAATLLNEAFEEDECKRVAYYVVKDKDGNILFFYSLKCGQLYDEFIEGERLKTLANLHKLVVKRQEDKSLPPEERKELEEIAESIRTKKGIKRKQVADVLHKSDKEIDINKLFLPGQYNVGKTYSGVELLHFCANDQYHDQWQLKDVQPLGAVIFWNFVVPQVTNIMEIVGCEYLFLFAADLTDDEDLVNYYREYLGFTDNQEHKAAMPLYDLTCKFMYQKTIDLENKKKEFFDNFNRDEDAI